MKIVSYFLLVVLLVACGHDEKDESIVNTISVPFPIKIANFEQHIECDGSSNSEPAVYIFENFDGIADDVDEYEPNPIDIANNYDLDEVEYTFNLDFVESGVYRLSVTCEAGLDHKAEDNDIVFIFPKGVFLRVGELAVISDEDPLPQSHLNVNSTCTGCHIGTREYDIAFVDHSFVEGLCADCHN